MEPIERGDAGIHFFLTQFAEAIIHLQSDLKTNVVNVSTKVFLHLSQNLFEIEVILLTILRLPKR